MSPSFPLGSTRALVAKRTRFSGLKPRASPAREAGPVVQPSQTRVCDASPTVTIINLCVRRLLTSHHELIARRRRSPRSRISRAAAGFEPQQRRCWNGKCCDLSISAAAGSRETPSANPRLPCAAMRSRVWQTMIGRKTSWAAGASATTRCKHSGTVTFSARMAAAGYSPLGNRHHAYARVKSIHASLAYARPVSAT